MDISLQSSSSQIGILVGTSCDDDDYLRSEDSNSHTFSKHILAHQYIAIRVFDWSNTDKTYTLKVSFKPDNESQTPPPEVKPSHEYKNNLQDENSGNISAPEDMSNNPSVGTVKGELSINQGKAQYSLPIPVPLGVAGMEPKISLEYDSTAGNGYLGKGWSIGGLSIITRCPNTKVIDGIDRSIQLDAQDQYCMNGQRLIKIGESDTEIEYKTQIDNHSKIIAHKSKSQYGPESWSVYTKSGLVYEYGVVASNSGSEENYSKIIANYKNINTKYSRSLSQSVDKDQVVISWAVSTIRDRTPNKNKIEFFYNQDDQNEERYIKKIVYGGGQIEFNYELNGDRRDEIAGFLAGSRYRISELLGSIIIKDNNNKELEKYTFEYLSSSLYTTLTKIEHSVGGIALKPLDITWAEESFSDDSYTKVDDVKYDNLDKVIGVYDPDNSGYIQLFNKQSVPTGLETYADVNGDGFSDVVLFDFNGEDDIDVVYGGPNSSGKFETIANDITAGKDIDPNFTQMADINNDSKADFVVATKNGDVYVALSQGYSFATLTKVSHVVHLNFSDTPFMIVDLDNDGLPDIIHFDEDSVKISHNDNGVFSSFVQELNLKSSFTKAEGWSGVDENGNTKYPRRFADVNGDGYVDIVAIASDKTYIFNGTGKRENNEGFFYSFGIDDFSTNQGWSKDDYRGVADIDNNGTLDIVGFKDHTLVRYLSSKRYVAVTEFTNHEDQVLKLHYSSLMANNIYVNGMPKSDLITLTPAMQVVSYVESYDKKDTLPESIDKYEYRGYRASKTRGALGFARIKTTHMTDNDQSKNIQTATSYSQTFPYAGMISRTHQGYDIDIKYDSEGDVTSSSRYSYNYKQLYNNVYDLYISKSTVTDNLTATTTITQNDIFNDGTGDIKTNKITKYSDENEKFITITTNEYNDNKTDWLIGRLVKSTVTFQAPNSDDISHVTTFKYDPNSGQLLSETLEPDHEKLSQRVMLMISLEIR